MPVIDHTNNHIQQTLRDTSLAAFDITENTYSKGLAHDIKSKRSTAKYFQYDKNAFRAANLVKERSAGDVNPNAKYEGDFKDFNIKQYGLRVAVTPEEVAEADDVLDPFKDAAMFLTSTNIAHHEVKFSEEILTQANAAWTYSGTGLAAGAGIPADSINGAGNFEHFTETTSDPLAVLKFMMRRMQRETGLRPNYLTIGREVADVMHDNANVKIWAANQVGIHGGEEQIKEIIAKYLGLDVANINIIDMSYNNATVTDATAALTDSDRIQRLENDNTGHELTLNASADSWVSGKSILFHYKGPSIGKYAKAAMCRGLWTGLTEQASQFGEGAVATVGNEGVDLGNFHIRSYKSNAGMTHWVDGILAFQHQVMANDLGYLLEDCIP